MKFAISTTGIFYEDKSKRDKLTKLGFTFEDNYKNHMITEDEIFIEINNLYELLELSKNYGELVIHSCYDEEIPTIEIYDDYRE